LDGNRIDDTTIATDPQVLLPVVDGALAICRKQDVKFVRVQFTLDFATAPNLITLNPYPVATVFRASYYIKLPQGSHALINGVGNGYNLVFFLAVDDLRTLTREQVHAEILSVVQQDSPVLLCALDFNLQAANTYSNDVNLEIDWKILKLAWHQICASVFAEICTGYTNQPQAVLDHIKQSYVNRDGNHVCISVCAYYQRMMSTMRPFAGNERFPKSVFNALIDGMASRLLRIFKKYYADHTLLHDLFATFQCSCFWQILATMQTAKDKVQSISAITRDSIGGQAFAANTGSFASQAECTLDCYSQGGGYTSSDGYCSDGGYRSEGGTLIPCAALAASWDEVTGALVVRALTPTSETR
jgi:hypothetical protein